jgi:hypothetical protein
MTGAGFPKAGTSQRWALDVLLCDLPKEQVRSARVFLLGEVERLYISAGHQPPPWVNILRGEFAEH